MFRLIVAFVPLVAGIPFPLPAYGPGMGMGAGFYPGMMYPPMMYNKQMSNGANFYGGNKGYNDFANNAMAHESLRDNKNYANQGTQGVMGNQMVTRGNQGNQGYNQNVAGSNYNQGADGYKGAAQAHDVVSKDGYGGFGNAGHKKGHKTSGFHKSYHNVESGKDSKFLDEDHDFSEENFGKEFDKAYDDKAFGGFENGSKGGAFNQNIQKNVASRGNMAAGGAHGSNWGARGHQGYNNNQDMAYKNAQLQASRNLNGGMGHTGMRGGGAGVYYNGPQW